MSVPGPVPNPYAAQGLDPLLVDAESALEYESELVIGRRAFSTAQAFYRTFTGTISTFAGVSISWHDTRVDINEGSFAVVHPTGRLQGLVGEIVRVAVGKRDVYAYVVADSQLIPTDITLARRAFMAVGLLAQPPEGVLGRVEVKA